MADHTIGQWNQTTAKNNLAADGGWPENMDRSDVNDRNRENLAAVAQFHADGEWADLLSESQEDYVASPIGADPSFVFRVTAGTDPSPKFKIGSWVRVTGTGGSGVSPVLARVVSMTSYTTFIDITVDNLRDPAVDPSQWSTTVTTLPITTITKVESYFNKTIQEAAFHPVGVTRSQSPQHIPRIDDLGTHAEKAEGPGGGIDSDKLDGQHGTFYATAAQANVPNDVVNGDMRTWQQATTFDGTDTLNADGSYTADEIKLLTEGVDSVDVTRVTVAAGATDDLLDARYYMKMTAVSTSDRFALFGIIEAQDSWKYLGGVASFSFYVRTPVGGIGNVRGSILEWTGGAEDVFGSEKDPITTWTAEDTELTLTGNWAYAGGGAGAQQLATTGWARYTLPNIAIGTGTKNLGWMIDLDDDSHSASDELDIGLIQLEKGPLCTPFKYTPITESRARCHRFLQKTLNEATPYLGAGASWPNRAGAIHHAHNVSVGANTAFIDWRFGTEMRVTPTVTVYSPFDGATGNVEANGANFAATATNPGTNGVAIDVTADPGDGDMLTHAIADARYI